MSYQLIINPVHKTDTENPIHKAALAGDTAALMAAIDAKGTLSASEVFEAVIAAKGNGPVTKALMTWMHSQHFEDLTEDLLFSTMDELIGSNMFTAADIVRRHTDFKPTQQLYVNALGRGDIGEIGVQLEHIRKFGAKWSADVSLTAATMGRVGALKWLQENHCPIDWDKCLHAAVDNKSTDVLQWMYDINKIQSEHFDAIYKYSKTQGKAVKIAILAWLVTVGFIAKTYWCLCLPRKRIVVVTTEPTEEPSEPTEESTKPIVKQP